MDSTRWQRLTRLFEAAVDLSEGDRTAYLRDQCAGDDALREEVEALIRGDRHETRAQRAIGKAAAELDSGPVRAGETIGPYRLVRELGQGGTGTVWLGARDDSEYQSEVAIKLLRSVYDTHMRSRFLAERQILADLNHPNIARLFDGGTTEAGVPYVVMEFVEGIPIDRYCDRQKLGVEERVQLFRKVCSAVQYAHRRLIVHRDLKPANILVDKHGVPKLLDFGIAKLMPKTAGATLTDRSLRMLTPRYASPEQIRGQPITTASDIYSLGVLLYELLTGRLPYEVKGDDAFAVANAICEAEPDRPSTLARQNALTLRGAMPNLGRRLKGDLDNIVLKALRKEPDARYASVANMEDDLRHHLERLPVSARPATWHYRLSRFVNRHRWSVAAASIAIAGLIAATTFSLYQMRQAIQARVTAEQERSIAVSSLLQATLTAAAAAVESTDPVAAKHMLESIDPADRGWEWAHVEASLDQSSEVIAARDIVAVGLASGKLLTASETGVIRSWFQSEPGSTLQLPVGDVMLATFSGDGSRVATFSRDGSLELRDVQQGDVRFRRQVARQPIGLALSLDGTSLALATEDEVTTWSERSDSVATWSAGAPVRSISMSSDGSQIALILDGYGMSVYRVLDLAGRPLTVDNDTHVVSAALSSSGEFALTSNVDRTIRVREAGSTRVLERFPGHGEPAKLIAISPDDQWFASAGPDETVRVWSRVPGRQNAVFTGHKGPIREIQVSVSGQYVASLATDGTARLWDAARHAEAVPLPGGWAAFSANGSTIVALEFTGTLHLIDAASREPYDGAIVRGLHGQALAVSRDARVIATGNRDNISIIDSDTLTLLAAAETGRADAVALAFSPAGDRLAAVHSDGSMTLREVPSLTVAASITHASAPIAAAAFSPDGRLLTTAHGGGITIRDAASGAEVRSFELGDGAIQALAHHPADGVLATGWSDGAIRFIDTRDGTIPAEFVVHTDSVGTLAFSPDGQRMASGSLDSALWISDVATARPLMRLNGLTDSVQSLEFSPDSRRLIATSSANELRVWDTYPARHRWDAAERLRMAREIARPEVARLFESTAVPSVVATQLRKDEQLTDAARRAALQLTLQPRTPPNNVSLDPFDGYAIEFAGNDSHVRVHDPEALRMAPTFTIEAWIYPMPFAGGATPLSLRMIFNKEGEYQLAIRPSGELLWTIGGDDGWLGWANTRYAAHPGRWTHVALVRDGATVKFFANGRLVQDQPVPEQIGDRHPLMNELRIGGRQHTPSSFRGRIDEMRIWSTARSGDDIRRYLRDRVPADAPGLLAAWSFDEGSTDIAADQRGRHPGTLVDATWVETSVTE